MRTLWHAERVTDSIAAQRLPGVLIIHGFTGSPVSVEPLAAAVTRATGAPTAVPLLSGHGTRWQDMRRFGWKDWCDDVRRAADGLRCDRLVVVGLSMGGALAARLAERDARVVHTVLINPAVVIDSPVAPLLPVLARLIRSIPAIGNDIAIPGADESAYPRTPLVPLDSFRKGQAEVRRDLTQIRGGVTLCKSTTDHVVGPRSAAILRAALGSRLTIVPLRRSYHVATLDYDAPAVEDSVITAVRQTVSVPPETMEP